MVLDQDALDLIHRHLADSKDEAVLDDNANFFGGRLRVVRLEDSRGKREVCLYTNSAGSTMLLDGSEALVNFLSTQKTKFVFWEYFISVVGISGVIAVLITIGILIQVVYAGKDAPGYLVQALTVILGFYFGAAVKGASGMKT